MVDQNVILDIDIFGGEASFRRLVDVSPGGSGRDKELRICIGADLDC
jgi:hypothetical protein